MMMMMATGSERSRVFFSFSFLSFSFFLAFFFWCKIYIIWLPGRSCKEFVWRKRRAAGEIRLHFAIRSQACCLDQFVCTMTVIRFVSFEG